MKRSTAEVEPAMAAAEATDRAATVREDKDNSPMAVLKIFSVALAVLTDTAVTRNIVRNRKILR